MKKLVLSGLALALSSFTAIADVDQKIKDKVSGFIGKGKELNFFNSESGLIGVGVTTGKGEQRMFYSTTDGEYVLAGAMVKVSSGKNITIDEIAKYAPKPNYDQLLSDIQKTNVIVTGDKDAENEIYAFIDPNCGYCHRLYSELYSSTNIGEKVKVNWIPVAVLGMSSINKTQSLLGTDDEHVHDSLKSILTKLPYKSDPKNIAAGQEKYKANMKVFKEQGFSGVPVIIKKYKGKVELKQGLAPTKWIESGLNG